MFNFVSILSHIVGEMYSDAFKHALKLEDIEVIKFLINQGTDVKIRGEK